MQIEERGRSGNSESCPKQLREKGERVWSRETHRDRNTSVTHVRRIANT